MFLLYLLQTILLLKELLFKVLCSDKALLIQEETGNLVRLSINLSFPQTALTTTTIFSQSAKKEMAVKIYRTHIYRYTKTPNTCAVENGSNLIQTA